MRKPRIGMVGLGNIAQKAYLPILSVERDWSFAGAFSPTESKRKEICRRYRLKEFSSLPSLMEECDAVFVHSSTASHFEVVSELLKKGKDVYVDKPLAATLSEAKRLVELSEKTKRKLMVGFNRRFAPMYVKAKKAVNEVAWMRIEKHRTDHVGPASFEFTMLDDYIHLVDTARWLGGQPVLSFNGHAEINDRGQLVYTHHCYQLSNQTHLFSAMHRNAGTNLEQIEIVSRDRIVRVKNMDSMELEEQGEINIITPSAWETTLKKRGFEGAVSHFIDSITGDTLPAVDGLEALKTQQIVSEMIQQG
ncbi:Gfo/Idh/MocA family protein [Paenactinomyces guangxiensis]|uniref:Gfo/Idh/MocA family oxidoreductase n=1 Tax=Paenactinomyces guangxiensis TaxID=1490290 RepID=A0A7W2A6T0_9BACL|nr:Gfo/Idh/MocA family oxidoreductase [Paenactinomyces guangxiensis]MBA4493756.1 Gfo/Idh/MocA family oxidoreductase [Paenactinomyces guangxiensis]MBH8591044.1 Gfo/Idh/MocA family oxidoreductase [Paenactinomyces guangxiensis]